MGRYRNLPDKLTLGLDLDNTTASYTDAFARYVAGIKGVDPATLVQPDNYDGSYYEREWGIDSFVETHRQAVSDGLFLDLIPYPGAIETIQGLADDGIRIKVLTSRLVGADLHAKAIGDTILWLDKWDLPYKDLIVTDRKAEIECDVYIDDSPGNIEGFWERGLYDRTIIYDQPPNRQLDGIRVTDWVETKETLYSMFDAAKKRRFALAV